MNSRVAFSLFLLIIMLAALLYSWLPYSNPPSTVPYVDLKNYLGIWKEIAAVPQTFSKGCICNFANYTSNADGTIRVENYCRKQGVYEHVVGEAWPVDSSNSKLKVEFYWPFRGDYWIVRLGQDYKWVVVSDPGRKYLWILARENSLEQGFYDGLVEDLRKDGFRVDDLVVTSKQC